jgi:uroporphyrinogen decarboxylase
MRDEIVDRYYRTFMYRKTDRVPDIEFGYWPQTIRRWLKEGMPLDLTPEEQRGMFVGKVDWFLRHEQKHQHGLTLRWGMHPEFEEKVVERREKSVVMVDRSGSLAERYLADSDASSIPHFLSFPVKTPADWKRMKEKRYRLDDPWRKIPADEIARAREAAAKGHMIAVNAPGPYGVIRGWMGFENLSVAFYDHPKMIRDMTDHLAELTVRQIRRLPKDLPIDHVCFWEDMASKNGPFVGPQMFREFLQPCYRAIMKELRKRGCALGIVDCDGNPHDIVANWLEEGVNIMFPLEVAAGVDPYAWRREFGLCLRIRGGIAKTPIAEGGAAIDRELERIRPLLDQGGYVPHLDHLVPPDISYDNYRRYLEKKWKLIGKA